MAANSLKFIVNRVIPQVTNFALTSNVFNGQVKTAVLNSSLIQSKEATVLWHICDDDINEFIQNLEDNYNKSFEEDFQGKDPFQTGVSVNTVKLSTQEYMYKRVGETIWEISVGYRLV